MKLEKMKLANVETYDCIEMSRITFDNCFSNEELEFLKKNVGKRIKLIIKEEKPVLDEEEKEYLFGVISPFCDKVSKIIKRKYIKGNNEYIMICIKDDLPILLPDFKKGTMYKNMELDKEYTLKDLDI